MTGLVRLSRHGADSSIDDDISRNVSETSGHEPDLGAVGDASIAVLTIDNPPLNLLSLAVRRELAGYAAELSADPSCRVVVLDGAGERAFCAGSDVKEFPSNSAEGRNRAREERTSFDTIAAMGQPVIAALKGHVLGGGLELALCADLRVADEHTTLGFPEVGLGLLPTGGGTQRLPRLLGPSRAKQLLFTGQRIGPDDAHRLGLVDEVAPNGTALRAAIGRARQIAAHSPDAVRAIKAAIQGGLDAPLQTALDLEEELGGPLFGTPAALRSREQLLNPSPPRRRTTS